MNCGHPAKVLRTADEEPVDAKPQPKRSKLKKLRRLPRGGANKPPSAAANGGQPFANRDSAVKSVTTQSPQAQVSNGKSVSTLGRVQPSHKKNGVVDGQRAVQVSPNSARRGLYSTGPIGGGPPTVQAVQRNTDGAALPEQKPAVDRHDDAVAAELGASDISAMLKRDSVGIEEPRKSSPKVADSSDMSALLNRGDFLPSSPVELEDGDGFPENFGTTGEIQSLEDSMIQVGSGATAGRTSPADSDVKPIAESNGRPSPAGQAGRTVSGNNGHSQQPLNRVPAVDSGLAPSSATQPQQPAHSENTQATQSHRDDAHVVGESPTFVQAAPPAMAPQYIPVPMPFPMTMPAAASDPELEQHSPVKEQRPEPVAKLPAPEDTGAEITMPAVSESSVELQSEGDESQSKENLARQKKAALAYAFFQKQLDAAQVELQKQQEPFTGKLPRLLKKHIGRLEDLKSSDFDEIVAQLRVIGRTRSPAAVPTLREYASHKRDAVRTVCAEELAGMHDVPATLALLGLLPDGVTQVVDIAVKGLLQSARPEVVPPVLALALVHPRLRAILRDEIAESGPDGRLWLEPVLVAALKTKTKISDYPALALHLLSRVCDSDQLKVYTKYTKHPSAELRVAGIEALSYTGQKQAVPIFNKCMEDRVAAVRAAAATALSKLNSPRSATLLISALKDSEPTVRRAASKSLTEIKHENLADSAAAALSAETDALTIEHLMEIIGRSGSQDALQPLKTFVQGDDLEMRRRAISTLRRLKNPKSAKFLVPLLDDEDVETRRSVVEALGQIGHKATAPKIRELLKRESSDNVRAAAIRALGELKDKDSLPLLEEVLHDGRMVQIQSIIAMGSIGAEDAVPALLAQLRNPAPEVRYHACTALGQIGTLANTTPVAVLLDDKDAMVRRGAESALGKLGAAPKSSRLARQIKRSLFALGDAVIPRNLGSMMPGGAKGLMAATAVVLFVALAGAGQFLVGLTGTSGANLPVTKIAAVAVASNGNVAFVGRGRNVGEFWDVKEGKLLERFESNHTKQAILSASGDAALLFAATAAVRYDLSGTYSKSIEEAATAIGGLTGYSPSVDGKTAWISVSKAREPKLMKLSLESLDVSQAKQVEVKLDSKFWGKFAMSPDEEMLVVPTNDGLWLHTGPSLEKAPAPLTLTALFGKQFALERVKDVAFNHDGTLLAVCLHASVGVIELPAGNLKAMLFSSESKGEGLVQVRFTDAAGTLVAVSQSGRRFEATNDLQDITTTTNPKAGGMHYFQLTADASTAVFCEEDSRDISVLDLQAGTVQHNLKGIQD